MPVGFVSDLVRGFSISGRNKLFEEMISERLVFYCRGIKRNEFIQDLKSFTKYILHNKVTVSAKWKVISLSQTKAINKRLVNPDEEELSFHNRKGKKEVFKNKIETQFPKVNFLHNVLLSCGKIKINVKRDLLVTSSGEKLIKEENSIMFGEILKCWVLGTNWDDINKRHADKYDHTLHTTELSKYLLFPILEIMYKRGKWVRLGGVLDDILGKTVTDEDALARVMMPIFFRRDVLFVLEWMQVVRRQNNKFLGLLELSAQADKVQLTPFGNCVVGKMCRKANSMIPGIYKEFLSY